MIQGTYLGAAGLSRLRDVVQVVLRFLCSTVQQKLNQPIWLVKAIRRGQSVHVGA